MPLLLSANNLSRFFHTYTASAIPQNKCPPHADLFQQHTEAHRRARSCCPQDYSTCEQVTQAPSGAPYSNGESSAGLNGSGAGGEEIPDSS